MSSCQGELADKEFDVTGTDQNGVLLVNGTVTSLPNGFFELWLPRNRRIALTVRRGNRSARGIVETFDTSKTCITTLQLQ